MLEPKEILEIMESYVFLLHIKKLESWSILVLLPIGRNWTYENNKLLVIISVICLPVLQFQE